MIVVNSATITIKYDFNMYEILSETDISLWQKEMKVVICLQTVTKANGSKT